MSYDDLPQYVNKETVALLISLKEVVDIPSGSCWTCRLISKLDSLCRVANGWISQILMRYNENPDDILKPYCSEGSWFWESRGLGIVRNRGFLQDLCLVCMCIITIILFNNMARCLYWRYELLGGKQKLGDLEK